MGPSSCPTRYYVLERLIKQSEITTFIEWSAAGNAQFHPMKFSVIELTFDGIFPCTAVCES